MQRKILASAIFALFAFFAVVPAKAQQAVTVASCGSEGLSPAIPYALTQDQTGKLCVNAAVTVSASIAPFTPSTSGARGTPIAVTTSDSSGTLPTNTGAVLVSNPGANLMYCNVNGVAATISDQPITSGGGWFNFGIPSGVTALHCIATGGSTTANMVGGSGLATGTGGGGGSGGGGGAVTLASGAVASGAFSAGSYAAGAVVAGAFVDGWDLTQGTKADAACSTDNGTCSIAALLKRNNQNQTTLNTTAGNPIGLPLNVTPTDCSGTVASGGTANNAFTAQTTLHGFTILNDDTSEPLWISFTTTAAAATAGSYPLAPATATSFAGASSFTSPPGFGTNHALSVVAATTSHKFSCTWW